MWELIHIMRTVDQCRFSQLEQEKLEIMVGISV